MKSKDVGMPVVNKVHKQVRILLQPEYTTPSYVILPHDMSCDEFAFFFLYREEVAYPELTTPPVPGLGHQWTWRQS